ncbi:MAG: OB-fold domain-containing protein [Casimicrobiaceae bacterium]
MTAETGYAKPIPRIDDRNRPHWEGNRAGELRVQRCTDCDTHRFPASRFCPTCLGENATWVATSGKGEIWSWCVFHRAYFKGFEPELPYAVVLVKLDDGVRVYSNVVDVPREQLRIGMRVRAIFDPVTDEVTLVKFREDS